VIHPERSIENARVDDMLEPPPSDTPALTSERELARLAARYGRHTAAIAVLTMEYPWRQPAGGQGDRRLWTSGRND
jgi:hypothetical protein